MIPWLKKNKALYKSGRLSVKTKGLENQPGQNNCFLNSAVQVLWHLDVFRTNFARMTGHNCVGESSCIFCAMKHLFARFKYSDQEILPPTDLRVAMSIIYQAQNRFQLGLMEDAAECFENLLLRIHSHVVEESTSEDNMCSAKHCISHQKFGMMLIEQGVCECGETSEPLPFIQLVHYVSATALCAKLKARRKYYRAADKEEKFARLIRSVSRGSRKCPSNCGSEIATRTSLMNAPDVISIGVNWDSEEPAIEHIIDFIHTLSTMIKLQDMFDSVLDKNAQRNEYHLSAVVCYYGKHYSTFFFNRKANRWLSIDDAAVSEVGKHWRDVLIKCIKGHYQPLLLLYTNYAAESMNFSSGPTSIKKIASSVTSSPALSRRDSEAASSSSSGSLSPAHVPMPVQNGNSTRPKKFQWNTSVPSRGTGHYKEPKAGTSFLTYKPYENPSKNSNSFKVSTNTNNSNDINENLRGFPTL
ncbi:ubiquitin carboxyl-terminal hydrolase 54-like [Styela clava]